MGLKLKLLTESKIACGNCVAACCRCHDRIYVEGANVPPQLCEQGLKKAMKLVPDPGYGGRRCIALDPVSDRCTIYGDRPNACREFKEGGQMCKYIRNEVGI